MTNFDLTAAHRTLLRQCVRVGRAAIVLPLLTGIVVGCSSTKSGSSAPTTVGGPKGAPINVVDISTVGNPAANNPQAFSAAQAAAAAINKAGGIQGRPLHIITCNDNYDPNTAVQCARTAVSDSAVAVIGDGGVYANNYFPILLQAGIPSIGNSGAQSSESTDANSFPLQFNSNTAVVDLIIDLIKHGKTKIAIPYVDVAAAQQSLGALGKGVTALGGDLVATIPIAPTAVDMAPYAAKLQATSANGYLLLAESSQVVSLIKDLNPAEMASSGALLAQTTAQILPAQAKTLGPAANGILLLSSNLPSTDTANPGIVEFNHEMDAYGMTDPREDQAISAYVSVHLIANLLQNAPTISSAALTSALNTAGTIYFPDQAAPIIAPFNFADPIGGKRVFSDQVVTDTVQNGAIVNLTGFAKLGP